MPRKAPAVLAKAFGVGTRRKGLDGCMWVVGVRSNGVRFWRSQTIKIRTLVVCSCPKHFAKGQKSDYEAHKAQVERVVGGFGSVTWISDDCMQKRWKGMYPDDVRGKYDVIWFAGCDGLVSSDLSPLKKGGKVVFTSRRKGGGGPFFDPKYADAVKRFPSVRINKSGRCVGYMLPVESFVAIGSVNLEYWKRTLKQDMEHNPDEVPYTIESIKESGKTLRQQRMLAQKIKKQLIWNKKGYYIRV